VRWWGQLDTVRTARRWGVGFRGTLVVGFLCLERTHVMTNKQKFMKALADLPDDAGIEDALERLYLLYKIENGIRQADADQLVSQEEARRRMARWLE
jgi:hypothetical protein